MMSAENSQNVWPASPAFGDALSLPQSPFALLSVPQTPSDGACNMDSYTG